jgi:hypothetical protein
MGELIDSNLETVREKNAPALSPLVSGLELSPSSSFPVLADNYDAAHSHLMLALHKLQADGSLFTELLKK